MKDIKNIILSALFLALAVITTLFEVPYLPNELGLKISFSICIIFLSLRQVGFKSSLIIVFIFPWFSLLTGSGGIIGASFVFISSFVYILFDSTLLYFVKYKYKNILFVPNIILLSFIFLILNLFIFIPLWGGGWSPILNDFGDYFIKNSLIIIPFNIINLSLNIILGILLNVGMEKIQ